MWRETLQEPIETYELNTLTYGTASASYLATRVLRQVSLDNTNYTAGSEAILRNFYVDDFLTDTVEETIVMKRDLTSIRFELAEMGL